MSAMTEKRPVAFFRAAKAVFWSFLGIRRRSQHEQDIGTLKPAQVIVAGLIGAAMFVLALVALVQFIVRHAT